MKMITSIKATVNLHHKYTCDVCHQQKYGEQTSVEFTDLSKPSDLDYRIQRLLPPAYAMPMNWGQSVKIVNGGAELIFLCDKCVGE